VVLFGPTSSGKTGLSLDLAERYRRRGSWFKKLPHVQPPRGGDAAQWIVEQG
jgi:hypothetical protein